MKIKMKKENQINIRALLKYSIKINKVNELLGTLRLIEEIVLEDFKQHYINKKQNRKSE